MSTTFLVPPPETRRPDAAGPAPAPALIGESGPMQSLRRKLARAAQSDVPLMITGETGTGKELAARATHAQSRRSRGPFVVVNCAALPENLIHSELFGHERGAFTGAHERKLGRLEAAAGGTLFLDEVGELSIALQANLLRFLQEGTVERLGDYRTIRVDVRVIAATNIDLEAAVTKGRFREDLYYRLNVFRVHLPPLRKRERDAELVARHFLERVAREEERGPLSFTPDALAAIANHDWPGNVREVLNRVRLALVNTGGRWISALDLELEGPETDGGPPTLAQIRAFAERAAIQDSLRRNDDNVTHAARELGVSRVTLYRLMDKHGVRLRGELQT